MSTSSKPTETTVKLVAHQMELERLYNKNQLIPRLKSELISDKTFNFSEFMETNGINTEFGYALLVQMSLHKRASLETLVGVLLPILKDAQQTVDMLLVCVEADLLHYAPDIKQFIVRITFSDDIQEELDKFQYPLPMVVEPKILENNRSSGYLLSNKFESVILRNNHHNGDICLDHLNRVNKYAFSINNTTVSMIKNSWKNLDRMKEDETREDFRRRTRAFEKYDRVAKDVMSVLMEYGNKFHLTHRPDKRGRIYAQGYHVNYQGTPWNKAVIEFYDTEITE